MSKASTLSEVARATGAKPRTLQFWTSSGVLVPEKGTLHGGPGTHRRYPHQELEIAAILASLNGFNLQVGTLRSLADYHATGKVRPGRNVSVTLDHAIVLYNSSGVNDGVVSDSRIWIDHGVRHDRE